MRERHESTADIKGVSVETMTMILEFIYSEKIILSVENVWDLYVAADYMQIPCK